MMDAFGPIVLGLATLVGFALIVGLGLMPGWIARSRGHPSTSAILVCGLVGIIVWPAWIVAIVWAFTGKDRAAKTIIRRPDLIRSMYGATTQPPSVQAIDSELDIGRRAG